VHNESGQPHPNDEFDDSTSIAEDLLLSLFSLRVEYDKFFNDNMDQRLLDIVDKLQRRRQTRERQERGEDDVADVGVPDTGRHSQRRNDDALRGQPVSKGSNKKELDADAFSRVFKLDDDRNRMDGQRLNDDAKTHHLDISGRYRLNPNVDTASRVNADSIFSDLDVETLNATQVEGVDGPSHQEVVHGGAESSRDSGSWDSSSKEKVRVHRVYEKDSDLPGFPNRPADHGDDERLTSKETDSSKAPMFSSMNKSESLQNITQGSKLHTSALPPNMTTSRPMSADSSFEPPVTLLQPIVMFTNSWNC
jgi:hypothetical protein